MRSTRSRTVRHSGSIHYTGVRKNARIRANTITVSAGSGGDETTAVRPRIGITARFLESTQSHSVHRGYVEHVLRADGVPIVLPFGASIPDDAVLPVLDGLMLTGGQDIDPDYLSGVPRQDGYNYQPERDEFELRLARAALGSGLPVLGVCRGCQVLHVAVGNQLIPHIPDVNADLVEHRKSISEPTQHLVTTVAGSKVGRAYPDRTFPVTSYHHQGLAVDGQMDGWRVTARSEDQLAEAIEYPAVPWAVGVLWHPELPVADDGRADPLISAFVTAAASCVTAAVS